MPRNSDGLAFGRVVEFNACEHGVEIQGPGTVGGNCAEKRLVPRSHRSFCRTVSNMWTSDECGACAGGGVR